MHALAPPLLMFAVAVAAAVVVPAGDAGVTSQDRPYEATGIRSLQRQGLSGAGVIVAYFDTGLDETHQAFAGLSVAGRYAFLNADLETTDADGHGTMVAGILAGHGSLLADRAVGIHMRGAAPGIDLLVFRTIAQAGGDTQASILREHVERAVASGADILCLSLGFGDIGYARRLPEDPPGERRSLGDAIEDALDQGVLVVAAAGTAHPDVTDVEFPAKIPGVIAVGAVDEHGRPAAFSPAANVTRNVAAPEPENRTNRWPPDLKPEIAAPGSGMLAPTLDGAWGKLSGTSAATPIVCGGLALLLEAHPELRRERDRDTVTGIKNALAATAQPVSGQVMPHDPVVGHGLFRADRLVDAYA